MSDVHKEIRDRLKEESEFGPAFVQWYDRGSGKWVTAGETFNWSPCIAYRLIRKLTGGILYVSLADPGIDTHPSEAQAMPASTDHNSKTAGSPAPMGSLTITDYADGCCKAALSLLMKPSREPEDIRKALAWLTLAVGGQR